MQLRSQIKELIACKNVDLEGKMFKHALKETSCQEQFSDQRGIQRFHSNPENTSSWQSGPKVDSLAEVEKTCICST